MKRMLTRIMAGLVVFVSGFSLILAMPGEAWAACPDGYIAVSVLGEDVNGEKCRRIGDDGSGIYSILSLVVKILSYLIAVLGTIGIAISGIQYLTSGGDVGKMTKAKNRIIQVVIGLVAYGLITAFLDFIIPGGVF